MPRPIRSFAQRLVETEKRAAMETVTTTERLLALILIELMSTRGQRGHAEISQHLRRAGFSRLQVAAMLDSTPAALAVAERRSEQPAPPERE